MYIKRELVFLAIVMVLGCVVKTSTGWPVRDEHMVYSNRVRDKFLSTHFSEDRASWLCSACKFIMELVHVFFKLGKTQAEIASLATKICIDLKIEDHRVCTLVIKEFKGEVLTVFEQVGASPKEICGQLLGDGCIEPYHFYHPWNVTLPKVPKPSVQTIHPPKYEDRRSDSLSLVGTTHITTKATYLYDVAWYGGQGVTDGDVLRRYKGEFPDVDESVKAFIVMKFLHPRS